MTRPERWWTKRQMVQLLVITALLWMGFVAALALHNGNVALVFLCGLAASKTYIFGQMFVWIREDHRDTKRQWDELLEQLGSHDD